MRYIHNKNNLLEALSNLYHFVEERMEEDGQRDNPIRAISENLHDLLEKVESEYPDVFGTEGYSHSILGND